MFIPCMSFKRQLYHYFWLFLFFFSCVLFFSDVNMFTFWKNFIQWYKTCWVHYFCSCNYLFFHKKSLPFINFSVYSLLYSFLSPWCFHLSKNLHLFPRNLYHHLQEKNIQPPKVCVILNVFFSFSFEINVFFTFVYLFLMNAAESFFMLKRARAPVVQVLFMRSVFWLCLVFLLKWVLVKHKTGQFENINLDSDKFPSLLFIYLKKKNLCSLENTKIQ